MAFRTAWETSADARAGLRYAAALVAADRRDDALVVCRAVEAGGDVRGRVEAARIEHGRGDLHRAVELLSAAVDRMPAQDLPPVLATLGRWRWEADDVFGAEPLLAAAAESVPGARVDLAGLLGATGRRGEARRLLEEGAATGLVACLVPLANMLDADGEPERAVGVYERAAEAGDQRAAWNVALVLARLGRIDEAEAWRERAALAGDAAALASLLPRDGAP